jgi:hypothetical protein
VYLHIHELAAIPVVIAPAKQEEEDRMYSLPFDDEKIDEILQDETAVVDMSQISFAEDADENYRIAMIYLRNINYSGKLDFSNVSYENKAKFLKKYITRDIKFLQLKELDYTILKLYNTGFKNLKSIFVGKEASKFKKENKELLDEMLQFILSLPLYIISRIKKETLDVTQNAKCIDTIPNSLDCVYSLLDYSELEALVLSSNTEPCFYTEVFKEENNTLYSKVSKMAFASILDVLFESAGQQG